MRFLSLALIGLACGVTTAAHPEVPEDFTQPQSAPRPAPFPIQYVDQGRFDPRLKGLSAPAGFRVEIVATDPVVVNPTGLTFAPDGTLFVAEWTVDPVTQGKWFEVKETFRFRDGTTKSIATMKKFVLDPIKVLKWNAETGVYYKAETVIGEQLPSTLLWHDGWLYTASRGTVRRHRQSQTGGPWDRVEVIAQGFCGFHHHQVSGLTIGNDNKLYITTGDDDNFAEGSDGSRATVLRSGAVFRCNPDGTQMEAFSFGYRNPYRDIVCDDKFNFFHADNDNEDGSKFTGCRLMHVAEGVDYGWRLRPGTRCCYPDLRRAAIAGELPGKLPPMLKTGRGSPAGLLIYNDTKLPEQYRGLLYYPDVFRKLVRAYKVAPQGASFAVTHEFELLKSDDPLFRPCQMVTGPDGAIYVCDWRTDSGGAGRLSGDGKNGRIYRLSWSGTPASPAIPLRGLDSWAKILKQPTAQLVDSLNAPDFSDRVEARKELIRRGKEGRDAVQRQFIAAKFTPDGRLVALGVLQANWSPDVEELFRLLLQDKSADVRRLCADALALKGSAKVARNSEAVAVLLTDDNPAVRRAAILALARIGCDGIATVLAKAWMTEASRDAFLEDAILRGIERLGPPGIAALLEVNTPDRAAVSRLVKAFTGFRTEPALAALPKLFRNGQLTAPERADLVRSHANYQFDPPLKLDSLTEMLVAGKPEPAVAIAALEMFALAGTADPKSTAWILGQLDSGDHEVYLAALKTIEASQLVSAGPQLVQILADEKRSVAERAAVLKALRTTAGASAIKPLTELLGRNEPALLKIDALRSLATASPRQARIVAESLLDSTDMTLVTEAIAVLGASKEGAIIVGQRYVAKRLPKELFAKVSDVVRKFTGDPEMAKLISDVKKGSLLLTMDLRQAEEIRKLVETNGNPERGKKLYLNTVLLACASCHKMEGTGGSVGPDLTRLWDTQTTAKILEAIVDPNKEIKEGYQSYKATTADGRTIMGLKVIDTPLEVTIRDAGGRDVRIPKADLESLTVSKTSLMPDNAIAQLTFDQFIDLLAFLKDRSAQESLRLLAPKPGAK
ncbi:c-type cytochrome [soil metagenome]